MLRPLGELIAAARRIAGGDYAQRVEISSVSDLERVAGSFNEMAGAIESDVGARERAEQEAVAAREAAEHANRAKSTFLAAMSHELRTPMIGVTGMLEVLAQSELSPSQRQMVATADSSAHSLLQIIGDILDLSKIEAAKLELSPATIDLRTVVGGCVETFIHTASAKGLLLTANVDERLAPAHVADPLRLRQIVSNFLSNAVKFTEVGGIEVDVRVMEDGDGAPGDRDLRQRHRDRDRRRAEGAPVRGVLPGGELDEPALRRDRPGAHHLQAPGRAHGRRRRDGLDARQGHDDDADARAGGRRPGRGRGVRGGSDGRRRRRAARCRRREEAEREGSLLLIVEDHPVNRTVLCSQLETIGFRSDTAFDGREGLERYRTGDYALVLTDLNMPNMDGFELARAIREHEAQTGAARVPIIALTASVMQGEPERARAAGMDDFAAKPTTIPFLAGRLRAWLTDVDWTPPAGEEEAASDPAGAAPAQAPAAVPATAARRSTRRCWRS